MAADIGLVLEAAGRLRLAQAELADESESVRADHLADEVERALSKVAPGERESFLKDLQAHFPSWDKGVEVVTKSESGAGGRSQADASKLSDPSFLATRLAELAPSMSEADRRTIAGMLVAAGIKPPAGTHEWDDAASGAIRRALKLEEGEPVDAERVMALLTQLVALAASLDQLGWSTWKQIAPRSSIRRVSPLSKSMARFATGDSRVGSEQLTSEVEALRKLVAALVAAVGQAGRQFAQHHMMKFDPGSINAIAAGQGGMLKSSDVKCWRQYCDLMEGVDAGTLERDIIRGIADFAEDIMNGSNRG